MIKVNQDKGYAIVRGVAWCWLIFAVLLVVVVWVLGATQSVTKDYSAIVSSQFIAGFSIIYFVVGVFNLKQKRWSYFAGIVLSVLVLPLFPLGTLIGALGLIGYISQIRIKPITDTA